MYTLQATDIDNGGEFFRKLNANFSEVYNPQSSHTEEECRTRFVQEMNKKAVMLGMSNTTYIEPAGNQPATYASSTGYDELFVSEPNRMSAYDALKCMLYATQFPAIASAINIDSFTLTIKREGSTVTETIGHSTDFTNQSAELKTKYDLLFVKGGTMHNIGSGVYSTMVVARSKSTGRVYAIVDLNTTTGTSASNNKYAECKKVLDYVDGGKTGAAPTFSQGGIVCIEMPQFSPTIWNNFDWANRVDGNGNPLILFSYGKDYVGYPCSMSKIMTAILLCENFVNLNTMVTVHEKDRQLPSGYDFKAGDIVRLGDFLKCLMIQSSNTSAHVIARVVGGILLDKDANVMG